MLSDMQKNSGGGDAAFASYMVENGGVDMERIGKI